MGCMYMHVKYCILYGMNDVYDCSACMYVLHARLVVVMSI